MFDGNQGDGFSVMVSQRRTAALPAGLCSTCLAGPCLTEEAGNATGVIIATLANAIVTGERHRLKDSGNASRRMHVFIPLVHTSLAYL